MIKGSYRLDRPGIDSQAAGPQIADGGNVLTGTEDGAF